ILGPALGDGGIYSGWPHSTVLVVISVAVLLLSLGDHLYGSKRSGSALGAADHIHYAPVLKEIYQAAERKLFDPYNWLISAAKGLSALAVSIENGITWFYDDGVVAAVKGAGNMMQRFSDGNLSRYLIVALTGVVGLIILFLIAV
ncbi:MAG TPA: hypothetical protein GX706_04420, partial [Candidatus Moranbacteria bacterium]|nr:hypothetical protein [Candidatus Moranbacteria bacterium]